MAETFQITDANMEQTDVKESRLLRQARMHADRFAFSYDLNQLQQGGDMGHAEGSEVLQNEANIVGRLIKERLGELKYNALSWKEFWTILSDQATVIMRGLEPEVFVEQMSFSEAIALASIYNQECKKLEQEYDLKLEAYVREFQERLPGIIQMLQLPISVDVAERRLSSMHFAMADSISLGGSLGSHYGSSGTFLVGFHLDQPDEEFKNTVFHEAFHAISGKYQIHGQNNRLEHLRVGLSSQQFQGYGGHNLFETFSALNEAITESYANAVVGYESTTYLAFRVLYDELLQAGIDKNILEQAYFSAGSAPEFERVLPHLVSIIGGDRLVRLDEYIFEIQQINESGEPIPEEEYRAKVQAILAGR